MNAYDRAAERYDQLIERSEVAFEHADDMADEGLTVIADMCWEYGVMIAADANAIMTEWEVIQNGRKRSIRTD